MYLLYKTTCLIDGRYYIGIHNGSDPDYLGSGDWKSEENKQNAKSVNPNKMSLAEAIKHYGRENFKRTTISEFETRIEACNAEATLVTEEFIKSDRNFNLVPGGGYPPRLTSESAKKGHQTKLRLGTFKTPKGLTSEQAKKAYLTRLKNGTCSPPPRNDIPPPNHFGSRWINNGIKNKRISKENQLPPGFVEGRLMINDDNRRIAVSKATTLRNLTYNSLKKRKNHGITDQR